MSQNTIANEYSDGAGFTSGVAAIGGVTKRVDVESMKAGRKSGDSSPHMSIPYTK